MLCEGTLGRAGCQMTARMPGSHWPEISQKAGLKPPGVPGALGGLAAVAAVLLREGDTAVGEVVDNSLLAVLRGESLLLVDEPRQVPDALLHQYIQDVLQ